jgi:hypothetical protein
MNYRTIFMLLLWAMLHVTALLGAEPTPQVPQVVLLAAKAQKCDWHQGITLGEALAKMGGVNVSTVTLVRNGIQERVNVVQGMTRPLMAWDIIVAGQ